MTGIRSSKSLPKVGNHLESTLHRNWCGLNLKSCVSYHSKIPDLALPKSLICEQNSVPQQRFRKSYRSGLPLAGPDSPQETQFVNRIWRRSNVFRKLCRSEPQVPFRNLDLQIWCCSKYFPKTISFRAPNLTSQTWHPPKGHTCKQNLVPQQLFSKTVSLRAPAPRCRSKFF